MAPAAPAFLTQETVPPSWPTENREARRVRGLARDLGDLNVCPNGTVWWSEGWVSAIGTLNPAAASSLSLLYRPDVAGETALIRLTVR